MFNSFDDTYLRYLYNVVLSEVVIAAKKSYYSRIISKSSNKTKRVLWLLVIANVVPSTPVLVTPMLETVLSSETLVLTGGMRRNIPEDVILHLLDILSHLNSVAWTAFRPGRTFAILSQVHWPYSLPDSELVVQSTHSLVYVVSVLLFLKTDGSLLIHFSTKGKCGHDC
jgi:hypothetical protein